MNKSLVILAIVSALAFSPSESYAADDLWPVFGNASVGLSIGVLAGLVATVFSSQPGDHINANVGVGAAVGLACGLALGIYKTQSTAGFYYKDTNQEKLYGLTFSVPLK